MNFCRDAVGTAVLGGRIFAVGGYDGTSYLNSVECYEPQSGDWSVVSISDRHNELEYGSLQAAVMLACFAHFNHSFAPNNCEITILVLSSHGSDVSILVSVCKHSLFLCARELVCAISLVAHDLELHFANKRAMSLPGMM